MGIGFADIISFDCQASNQLSGRHPTSSKRPGRRSCGAARVFRERASVADLIGAASRVREKVGGSDSWQRLARLSESADVLGRLQRPFPRSAQGGAILAQGSELVKARRISPVSCQMVSAC